MSVESLVVEIPLGTMFFYVDKVSKIQTNFFCLKFDLNGKLGPIFQVLVIQVNVIPESEVSLNTTRENMESIQMFGSCEDCEPCKHGYMSVRPYVCMSVYKCTYTHISMDICLRDL